MIARTHLLVVCLLALGACGEDRLPGEGTGEDALSDVVQTEDTTDAGTLDGEADVPLIDVQTPDVSKPDGGPDTQGDASQGGKLGDPCEVEADCESGYCIMGPQGLVCSEWCSDVGVCPEGWVCDSWGKQGGLCVPRFRDWCRPCFADGECGAAGTFGTCAPLGAEGSFCTAACTSSEDCPAGASCTEVTSVDGATGSQCVPDDGTCECNAAATAEGATTSCELTNVAGSCTGTRTCTADGLSACEGVPPSAETCNGEDDDCDGQTDEGLGGAPCTLSNDHGDCPGTTACSGGEEVCTGAAAEAERCNGADDDCDGETDEAWPELGSPCDGPDEDLCIDGLIACGGEQTTICQPTGPTGLTEVCNGADDDCDGLTDEEWLELGAPCDGPDADLCENGAFVCSGDGSTTVCGAESPMNLSESCNGADDDCDGEIDEDWPTLGSTCDGPDEDDCATGTWACSLDGAGVTCADEAPAGDELCNGIDDDCDGETDEDWPTLDQPCDGPDTDLCDNGVVECAADGVGTTCSEPLSVVELCNGVDDDCDGETDEDWSDLGAPCDGPDADACATGTVACTPDGLGTECAGDVEPGDEVCDGADNDCDGTIDEGCAPNLVMTTFAGASFGGTGGVYTVRGGACLPVTSSGAAPPGAQWSVQLGLHATSLIEP
ncbi:MAG: hypothetical protein AMXMBFR64_62420 [Myxococcales bacterium]